MKMIKPMYLSVLMNCKYKKHFQKSIINVYLYSKFIYNILQFFILNFKII